jgi:hypothetical protein
MRAGNLEARSWLAAAAVVLVAAAVWLAVRSNDERRAPESTASTAGSSATGAAQETLPPQPVPAGQAEPAEGTPAGDVADAGADAAADRPEVDSDGPLLRVLLPGGAEPAARAKVEFLDLASEGLADTGRFDAPGYGESFVREHGVSLTTDADGTVRLPRFERYAWIQASLGDFWGRIEPRHARDEVLTLRLREERTLTIRTVDGSGVPTPGVPVGLFVRSSGIDTTQVHRIWRGVTAGPEASCTVPHLGWFFGEATRDRGMTEPLRFASLDLQMLDPPSVVLDPNRPPEEPVVLEAPAFGSVRVRLEASDGEAIAEEAHVGLEIVDEDRESWEMYDARDWRGGTTVDGSIRFEGIEAGRSFTLSGRTQGRRPVRREIAGPTVAGEEIEVSLRLGEATHGITFRLVDPDGEPFRERAVAVALVRENRFGPLVPTRADRTTDETGRVRIDLGSSTGTLAWEIWMPPAGESDRRDLDPEWMGEATADVGAGNTEIDAGDVSLRRVPLLVAGSVVDGEGRPLAGATVNTSVRGGLADDRRSTRTGPDGAFVLHGPPSGGDIRVYASKIHHESRGGVTVPPGTADCRLVLERATRLVGRVLLVGGIEPNRIRISLETAEGEERVMLQRDSSFAKRAAPGPATLRFSLRGHEEPLRVLEGIVLVEGETVDVGEIRLGDGLLLGEITVTTPEGKPIRAARIWKHPANRGSALVGLTDRFGRLRFPSPTFPIEILACGRGTRLVRATHTGEPLEVVLPRGIPVQVRFAGDGAAIDWSDVSGQIRRVPVDAEGLPPEGELATLRGYEWGSDGSFRYTLAVPGLYEISWELYRYGPFRIDGQRRSSVVESIVPPMRVTVRDSDEEQVFSSSFELADFEAARSRIDAYEKFR